MVMRSVLLAVSSLIVFSNVVAIDWIDCPPGQINAAYSTWDCAYIEFDMDRDDPLKGKVTSFVRRGYVGSPGGKSAWGINGGPGLSTKGFVPMFDYFMSTDSSLTSYLVDARGIGLSSPLHDCSDPPTYLNPYDANIMQRQDVCNQEIIAANSTVFPYFTTYHAALDLLGVMQAVNPDTISIYAASYGTFFANTLLQLPEVKADVVVYDGPVTASRWPLENNAHMQSMVTFDGIQMCINESDVCKKYMGEMGHIPKMTKDALKDGVLACISKVPWLADDDGNFFTSFYNNWMNPNYNKALLAPFWHRLYRCSDSDAEQLIFFNDARKADMATWTAPDPFDYSFAYAVNQGQDLYSVSGAKEKTYDDVVTGNEREFTVEGGDISISYAKYVSNWPFTVQNSLSHTYAKPTAQMHIMVGTLDANTPVGQSQWMKDAMGPTVNSTIHLVPYAQHGLVDPNNLCVIGVVVDLLSLKSDVDFSCLETCMPPPDWDGSEEETRQLSMKWFGTRDLWNSGFEIDEEDYDDHSDEVTFTQNEVIKIIVGICIPLLVIIIGLLISVVYLCSRKQDPRLLGQAKDKKSEDTL